MLGLSSNSLGQSFFSHDQKETYVLHARIWQFGWMGVFGGSLATNALMLSSDQATRAEKFDARLSLLTSGSGLLSLIFNPLPAAYAGRSSWESNPKYLDASIAEVERRRGWGHLTFLLTEQAIVASAIAFYDDRPRDAVKRFALGAIVSGLFAYTTPLNSFSQSAMTLQPFHNWEGIGLNLTIKI